MSYYYRSLEESIRGPVLKGEALRVKALARRVELAYSARRRELERLLGLEPHSISREVFEALVEARRRSQ